MNNKENDIELSLKHKTFSNTAWKFLERFFAQGVSLIISIFLARILMPDDFGVVSIVMIFFTFANVLVSGGLNTALIQKKNADEEDYSAILYLSIFISVIAYIVLFFSAPFISNLFGKPILTIIIRIMSLTLPINAVKSVWSAFISSNFQFKKFFFATFGGTVISAAVGIIMALKGFGPWALVAQQMVNAFIDTLVLMLTTKIKFVPRINFKKLKALFSYGWKILLANLIGTAYSEIVPFIIGVKYTDSELSYYTKGKTFPHAVSSTINNTLSAVLFPALSKKQDNKKIILDYTRKFIRVSSFVVAPIMLGLFAISDNFVSVLLTDKWMDASYYIKIFCIVSLFDVIAIGNCETIKAIGKSGVYLIIEIIKKSLYLATILMFIFFANNPQLLAIASIVCTAIQIIVNSIPNKILIGYSFKDQLIDVLPNLLSAGAMCGVVLLIQFTNPIGVSALIKQIIIGICIYFTLSFVTKNKSLLYLIDSFKSFMRRKKQ